MKEPMNNPGIELARQLTRERMKDFGEAYKKFEITQRCEQEHLDRLVYMLKLNGWSEDRIKKLESHKINSALQDICVEHRQLKQKIKEVEKENKRLKKINHFYEEHLNVKYED